MVSENGLLGQILGLVAQLLVTKPGLTMETMMEEESGWENEPRAGPPRVSQKGSRQAGSD